MSRTDGALIRCASCPGRPILPTYHEETDTRRCIRCQYRRLPSPHPEHHLCIVCARECPSCQAPTPDGQRCRACRGICRTCSTPLPERSDYATGVRHIPSEHRKDRHHRWQQTLFPRSWDRDQCDACRTAAAGGDALRAVLAALPTKIVRACGGGVPPIVIDTIAAELRSGRSATQLASRIERRWWGRWASLPTTRPPDDHHDGYRPDDIALWLLIPTPCTGRCEDGWHTGPPGQDDRPCAVCHGGRDLDSLRRPAEPDKPASGDRQRPTDRTTEALAYRPLQECEGRGGTCGRPVRPPHTQCPACLGWPWCACRRRRYDPQGARSCPSCAPADTVAWPRSGRVGDG